MATAPPQECELKLYIADVLLGVLTNGALLESSIKRAIHTEEGESWEFLDIGNPYQDNAFILRDAYGNTLGVYRSVDRKELQKLNERYLSWKKAKGLPNIKKKGIGPFFEQNGFTFPLVLHMKKA